MRIAKGAGCHPQEVVLLLQEYHKFRNMVEKMGQMNIGGMGNDLDALKRNPKQFAQQMSQAIDPRLLQQLGGMGNLMDMMKQMGEIESKEGAGMPTGGAGNS